MWKSASEIDRVKNCKNLPSLWCGLFSGRLSPSKAVPLRFLPRDEKFSELLNSVASISVEVAKLQLELLKADVLYRPAICRRGSSVQSMKRTK